MAMSVKLRTLWSRYSFCHQHTKIWSREEFLKIQNYWQASHFWLGHAERGLGFFFVFIFIFFPFIHSVLELLWLSTVLFLYGGGNYCFSLATSYLTLCGPMDCSMPAFPILLCLPEFAQNHVHRVGNAIWLSHSLSPSSSAFSPSQPQSFFPMS